MARAGQGNREVQTGLGRAEEGTATAGSASPASSGDAARSGTRRKALAGAGVFLGCVLLIALREPTLLLRPRFWGEEGKYFFAFAYANPWYDTLLLPFRRKQEKHA